MADSVALLFATNLATIGGHVAEMISIFVYPVVGYFWTRRRRRSLSVDFNITEELPRSMPLVEGMTNSIDFLAKCIANLLSVVQALESLTADEALPKISKGRERFEELMQEHRDLQRGVLTLMKELSDKDTRPDDVIACHAASEISQSIRLLQLKAEMLSVEIRQAKIVYSEGKDVRVAESVDLELGMSNSPPLACINNDLHLDERVERLERNELERDAISRVGSSVTATTPHQSCPPSSKWLLEELPPAREQLIQEIAGQGAQSVSDLPTEPVQVPKRLAGYGGKKRPGRPRETLLTWTSVSPSYSPSSMAADSPREAEM